MAHRMLAKLPYLLLGVAIVLGWTVPSFAKDVYKTFAHKRDYPDSRDREYILHVPPSYDPAAHPLPLVMVLHGCKQTHETIKHDTNFDAIADQEGFLVVYPFITSYDGFRAQNCWGFWFDDEIHAGRGEVQDLRGIVEEVMRDYRVDPKRIHITGLSSGAGMTVAALVAHCDLFASGAPTAGLPYSETASSVGMSCAWPGSFKSTEQVVTAMNAEMGARKRTVPIYIIHSTNDCTVNIKAAEHIRDSWGKTFDVDTTHPRASREDVTKGTHWTHSTYGGQDGSSVIETLFVEGLPHGWYGDQKGDYAFPEAPDTARLVWEFFKAHPNGPIVNAPTVSITSATVNEQNRSIQVKGAVSSPDSPETLKVQVELLGLSPQAPQEAQVNATHQAYEFVSHGDMANDMYYRPRVTATNAGGTSVVLGDLVALGQPSAQRPEVTITEPLSVDLDRASLRGTAEDNQGIVSVTVRFDGGRWLPAETSDGSWSYQGGGLPEGNHTIDVLAMNKAGLDNGTSRSVKVEPPYDATQLSNITQHTITSRIRMYTGSFGTADKSYLELFQQHGPSQDFSLYRAKNTHDWYAAPANIPRVTPVASFTMRLQPTPEPQPTTRTLSPRIRRLLRELQEELRREELEGLSIPDQGDGCPGCGGGG